MTIDIYCPVYNEATLLPHMVSFYKERFPDVRFHFYDNGSDDATRELISVIGCNLYNWDTGGQVRDDLLQEWKNSVWKNSDADWVFIIDCDEFVDIRPEQLTGTVAKHHAYEMIGQGENVPDINRGLRAPASDKFFAFKMGDIKDTNFGIGAHSCAPIGNIILSPHIPRMYHMRYLDEQYLINRYQKVSQRLSDVNKQHGWGWHYENKAEQLKQEYYDLLSKAEYVR